MYKRIISLILSVTIVVSFGIFNNIFAVENKEYIGEQTESSDITESTEPEINENEENITADIDNQEDNIKEAENIDENLGSTENITDEDDMQENIKSEEPQPDNEELSETPAPEITEEPSSVPDETADPALVPTSVPEINRDEFLGTGIKYSELSDTGKREAQESYSIREDVYLDCESVGMDFEKTTEVGVIIQNASLSAAEYLILVSHYDNEDAALNEITQFANFKYSIPSLEIESCQIYKQLLIDGKSAAEILQGALLFNIFGNGDIISYSSMTTEQVESILSEEQFSEFSQSMSIIFDNGVSPAADEEEEYNNDVSKYPQAPFSYDKNGNESFNESSGALGYTLPGVSLSGSNGFDLNLNARYDTSDSVTTEVMMSSGGVKTRFYDKQLTPLYLAAGWSIGGISSMNLFDASKYVNDYVLKTAEETYTLVRNSFLNTLDDNITINRYSYFKNMSMTKNTEYINNGVTSAYKLEYTDGRVEYFDAEGKVMRSSNRFGDTIIYNYYTIGTEDESLGQKYNKMEIIDTCGRTVVIERGEMENNHQDTTLVIKNSQGGVIAGTMIKFRAKKVAVPSEEGNYTTVLESYTNQMGYKTDFEYIEDDLSIFSKPNVGARYRSYFILTSVTYPTGAMTQYSYEKNEYYYTNKFQHYKLIKRCDVINGNETNVVNYSFNGDYRYNGNHSSTETNPDGVSITHNFVAHNEETRDSNPNYMFSYPSQYNNNYFALKSSEETYYMEGDVKKYISKVEYNGYYGRTYPVEIKTTIYDDEQNTAETTINSEYNKYRDLVKSWDAYANGDTNDTEHMTEYKYDDIYHTLTEKIYKKDSNTTVREEYGLTANSKSVQNKKIYENDIQVSREEYAYNDTESANPSIIMSYASNSIDDAVITQITYQDKSLPLTQTVGGLTTSYSYDDLGRKITQSDPKGGVTSYEYDNLGRVKKTIFPDKTCNWTSYYVGPNYNRIIAEDATGSRTEYLYDSLGRIINVTYLEAEIVVTSYAYDSMGRISSVTDGNGNVYNYQYDKQDRKIECKVIDGSGAIVYVEEYQYDVSDNETSCVKKIVGQGNDRVISAEYTDKYGNKVKVIAGEENDASVTRYTYNYIGEQTSSTTPNGKTYRVTTSACENQGTKEVTTNPAGHKITVMYDMLGRKIETIDANENHSYNTYDNKGRLISEKTKISGSDAVKLYEYDNNGNITKESMSNNKPGETLSYRNTYYTYDSMNRIISAKTDEEGETRYTYDSNGNMLTMTTGITETDTGVTTSYRYTDDGRNLLVRLTDPMGYEESYTYDNNENVLTQTDKNGVVTTNTYNGINNIMMSFSASNSKTQSITYTYYGSGMLQSVTNADDTITYSYNNKGQVIGESHSIGDTINYSYDKNGNQTRIILNSSRTGTAQDVSYTYDALDNMKEVKNNKTNEIVAVYNYDNNGNVTEKKTNGNSIITKYEYNESNLIKSVENQTIADPLQNRAGTYSKYTYNYYLDGNRAEETDIYGNRKVYTYDGAGRLTSEEISKGTVTENIAYVYDARGNRVQKKVNGQIKEAYAYDENNRVRTQIKADESLSFEIISMSYDQNGNLTRKEAGEVSENYEYDLLGRMTKYYTNQKCEDGDYPETQYTYDPTGIRIEKYVNGCSVRQTNVNGNVVGEDDARRGKKIYIRGLGGEIISDGENYYSYNGHGDTTNLIQKSREKINFAVTATYEYDAFGNCVNYGGESANNPFRYNGQYYDDDTGLIYLRNRYYDPSIGRFTQEDTYWNVNNMIYGDDTESNIPSYAAIAQSINLYVYCMNDPINGVDPWGMYDRQAAVAYARYYSTHASEGSGPSVRMSQDCTNFVSFCLAYGGGMSQSDDWYFIGGINMFKKFAGSYSLTWSVSEEQFKAFTNCTGEFPNTRYANGNAICIHDPQWISAAITEYNIQPGDVLYFLDPNTGQMGHTAIIVSTDNGQIIYAQHDSDKNDGNLNQYLADNMNKPEQYNYVYVVRIRDDA